MERVFISFFDKYLSEMKRLVPCTCPSHVSGPAYSYTMEEVVASIWKGDGTVTCESKRVVSAASVAPDLTLTHLPTCAEPHLVVGPQIGKVLFFFFPFLSCLSVCFHFCFSPPT